MRGICVSGCLFSFATVINLDEPTRERRPAPDSAATGHIIASDFGALFGTSPRIRSDWCPEQDDPTLAIWFPYSANIVWSVFLACRR
jgi:hypothetical protein